MIPKIIHYIWLGGKPLPKIAEKCMASWKKYCPDYEIKRWDETNLNISQYQYAKDAYDAKKYAFASDVMRFDVLYKYGGVYVDIDVEILKPIEDLLNNSSFTGFETSSLLNPGLIYASNKDDSLCEEILQYYKQANFELDMKNKETVCTIFTKILTKHGLLLNGKTQNLPQITVYSREWFCPIDVITNKKTITQNTRTIHWYNASWYTPKQKLKHNIKVFLNVITFGLFGKLLDYQSKVKTKRG